MYRRRKLEFAWLGKENGQKLKPRTLEDPDRSYHVAERLAQHDIFDNWLIFGDNLLALKALEQEFIGKVRWLYI